MERDLATIAKVTGGVLRGSGDIVPGGYSIDTRTLAKGDLFFAIVGPRQDGHRFVPEALGHGASAVVVSRAEVLPDGPAPAIIVQDTLTALQDLAAAWRRSLPARIVGITGSAGKTTTKEMTRQAMEAAFRVHASRGNLNNLFGCPLSLLQLTPQHQVSVLEMGMSYPGELTRLAAITDPDIGVLTNVSGVHLAHFASLDDVAEAKGELFAGMRDNATGIFNNDDERCRRIMGRFRGYGFTFGIDRPADLTASEYQMDGLDGCHFVARHQHNGGSTRVSVRLQFAGVHHVYNALAALSAGFMLGIDLEAMAARLADLQPLGMRGRVLRLGGNVRVVDDSYNSNPAAMRFALDVLTRAEPPAGGRRAVVFGDMLELGEGEIVAHREIGRAIAACGAELVVGVGQLSAAALEEVPDAEARHFGTAAEAAAWVADAARDGDIFLVKGSRGVGLEAVVERLRARFGEG
ncbi:MAG: UDP-N-acetylmuramoyl-tripeptide--D-alanyl-D-alanine ligase [Candidatus Polarisedimenticolia bacterium]